ncbi:hypothetical protein HYC85_017755 [Camellia sinensis]|uniref:Uncharacterized protein n=1 Tax=Camellia sinensis TaxID=4442 RepID=A0A7J7GW68_CAMSI|nr:hypothetical protein HYC85_017755 [Camellia sinensis]
MVIMKNLLFYFRWPTILMIFHLYLLYGPLGVVLPTLMHDMIILLDGVHHHCSVERQNLSRIDKYPHVVNVELAKPVNTQEEMSLEGQVNVCKTIDMEEAMIRGLTKMSWERVDIDFSGTKRRLLAHNTIQVKTYYVNSAGADVIQHTIDNFLL